MLVYVSTFSSWPLMTSTGRKWLFDVNTIWNLFIYTIVQKIFFSQKWPHPVSTGHQWSWAESTLKMMTFDGYMLVLSAHDHCWPVLAGCGFWTKNMIEVSYDTIFIQIENFRPKWSLPVTSGHQWSWGESTWKMVPKDRYMRILSRMTTDDHWWLEMTTLAPIDWVR